MTLLALEPGESVPFKKNIGREYKLDGADTLVVNVVASGFVLVRVPQNMSHSSNSIRGFPMKYEQFEFVELEPVRSNSLAIPLSR